MNDCPHYEGRDCPSCRHITALVLLDVVFCLLVGAFTASVFFLMTL